MRPDQWYLVLRKLDINSNSLTDIAATAPISTPTITTTADVIAPASAARPAGHALLPVATPTGGTSNGRPICLSDANDATGSGYGFENNQSCVVIAGTTATRNQPLLNQRICTPWFEIAYGNYKLQNNTWNDTAVSSDN